MGNRRDACPHNALPCKSRRLHATSCGEGASTFPNWENSQMCGRIQNSIWRDKVLNPTSFKAFRWWGKESKCEVCFKEDQVLWHWTWTPFPQLPHMGEPVSSLRFSGKETEIRRVTQVHTTTVWQKWGTRTPYLLFFLLCLNVPVFPFQKHLGNSNHKCFSPERFSSARGELARGEHAGKAPAWGGSCCSLAGTMIVRQRHQECNDGQVRQTIL